MKVAACMTPDPVCLAPDDTLGAAIVVMEAGDFRAVPVIRNDKLIGIISDRDIRKNWKQAENTRIRTVMTENPICISADDSVNEAVRLLLSHKIGGLPVIRNDKLVGIITTTDILKAVLGFPELEK
jgi:acetoin utilization protein AcuB